MRAVLEHPGVAPVVSLTWDWVGWGGLSPAEQLAGISGAMFGLGLSMTLKALFGGAPRRKPRRKAKAKRKRPARRR
jgi:hypothetical protein